MVDLPVTVNLNSTYCKQVCSYITVAKFRNSGPFKFFERTRAKNQILTGDFIMQELVSHSRGGFWLFEGRPWRVFLAKD